MPHRCFSRRLARPFTVASIVLVAALAGCSSSRPHEISRAEEAMLNGPHAVAFKVDGMACPNCAKHIEHELAEVPGVRAARVNFETKTAKVALDESAPASMDSLQAAVSKWKLEHFSAEKDPECLDPAKREEIKKQQQDEAAKAGHAR